MCLNFVYRYSTPGGYSSKAVHPIALAKVMSIAKMMKSEFGDKDFSLSGIGGVETGGDAAEFILLGANTVQVKGNNFHRLFIYTISLHPITRLEIRINTILWTRNCLKYICIRALSV